MQDLTPVMDCKTLRYLLPRCLSLLAIIIYHVVKTVGRRVKWNMIRSQKYEFVNYRQHCSHFFHNSGSVLFFNLFIFFIPNLLKIIIVQTIRAVKQTLHLKTKHQKAPAELTETGYTVPDPFGQQLAQRPHVIIWPVFIRSQRIRGSEVS